MGLTRFLDWTVLDITYWTKILHIQKIGFLIVISLNISVSNFYRLAFIIHIFNGLEAYGVLEN